MFLCQVLRHSIFFTLLFPAIIINVHTIGAGKMSDIMTHTLFNLYNPPEGFCFDYLCSDEPICDDPDAMVYNADKRVSIPSVNK